MYEYRCKVIKVIDGDTVDVDIDLGFDIIIKGDNVRLQDSAGGNLLIADTNDAVQLYYGYILT